MERTPDEEKQSGLSNRAKADHAKLVQATAEFFGRYKITHIVTLTTRFDMDEDRLRKEFYRYKRDLERRSREEVGWAIVIEYTYLGRAHLHAVLSIEDLAIGDIRKSWQRGTSHVEEYDPSRGWLFYLSKRIPDGAEWDFGGLVEPVGPT